ncbi:MAG: alpha/beta hydrolase [Solobacterium sp.]|nr:alpha/beta hydrolase [Solobacterium sp.]
MDTFFNEDWLVREDHYRETMDSQVLPFLQSREQVMTVNGDGNKPLYSVSYAAEKPVGSVLIVHGFTENAYKYAELIYSLLHHGLSVVAYDQRGHGRSWRSEDIKDTSATHVDHFDEYVTDMEAVISQALSRFQKPWMVFAHSMGGAVTSLYLERHPDTFSRAVLCAPMIEANRGGLSMAVGKLICRTAVLTGKAKERLFNSKPYSGPENFATSCATSKARFDWYDDVKQKHPEFHNNGPTFGWTLQSLLVTQRILSSGAVEKISCPVRLYTAELDNSVLPDAQIKFADRLKNGKRVLVKGARHEIYRSTDDVFYPWWHDILTFMKEE